MQFISCISLCRTVCHLTYTEDTELQKPPHLCLWFDEPFCDLLLNMGTLKSPYLVLKFAQRIGKNALCNGVPTPHSEICPSQSFVNIWQSGGQFLKDFCLWLRTFFKPKRLSLQVGRELIFSLCRKAYSRNGYELLDLRSENSILFSGISGFHPGGWDTVEMHVPIVFKEARHYSRYQKVSA